MKKLLVLLTFLSLSLMANDSDHPQSTIKGKGINLITKGHEIAGVVNGKMILGTVPESRHKISYLSTTSASGFESTSFTTLASGTFGGMLLNNNIEFVSLDKNIPAYTIAVNGKKYVVRVEADNFQNNHFINPTYILELENGDEVSASMESGQACYMYSMHLIFMIFGTYLI